MFNNSDAKDMSPVFLNCTIGSICMTICSIPWMIVMYHYTYNNPDPLHCYNTEGSLEVFAEPQGTPGEVDVAAVWRECYKWIFILHIVVMAFGTLSCISSILSMAQMTFCMPVSVCFYVLTWLAILSRVGFWVYMLYLRLYEPGRVCAGDMTSDCYMANSDNEDHSCGPEGVFQKSSSIMMIVYLVL